MDLHLGRKRSGPLLNVARNCASDASSTRDSAVDV